MTLDIDETLLNRFRNLRECVAQGVYRQGLTWVAGKLDESPGNLSSQLGGESQRKFGIDDLEKYIDETGDTTPVYYLVSRFLGDETVAQAEALGRVQRMLQELPGVLSQAGFQTPAPRRAASPARRR